MNELGPSYAEYGRTFNENEVTTAALFRKENAKDKEGNQTKFIEFFKTYPTAKFDDIHYVYKQNTELKAEFIGFEAKDTKHDLKFYFGFTFWRSDVIFESNYGEALDPDIAYRDIFLDYDMKKNLLKT